jgi:hypothetical protein
LIGRGRSPRLLDFQRLYRASRAAASAAIGLFAAFIGESAWGATVVIAQQAPENQGIKICFRANHWKSRRDRPI